MSLVMCMNSKDLVQEAVEIRADMHSVCRGFELSAPTRSSVKTRTGTTCK